MHDLKVNYIICVTPTGQIAQEVSRFRPEVGVFACTMDDVVVRQLNVVRGISAINMKAGD